MENLQTFTDEQIEEIAKEMVKTRFRYLSIEVQMKLLNPVYLQEQGISNDLALMEREDFVCVITLLEKLGVPVPVYQLYSAHDERNVRKYVVVAAFHEAMARNKATSLLQIQSCYVVFTEHTQQCLDLQQRDVEWIAQWPNYCKECGGQGRISESFDPSPSGVSLSGGSMTDTYPCEHCTDKGICPRCGQAGLTNEDEERGDNVGSGPCAFCAWDYNQGGRPAYEYECECGLAKSLAE